MSRAQRVLLRGFLLGLFAMVPMFGCGMPTPQEPAASEQTTTVPGQQGAVKPLKSGIGVGIDTPIGSGETDVGDNPGVGVEVQTPIPAEGSVEITSSNEEPDIHIEQARYYRQSGVTVYYGPRYGYYRPYYSPYRPYRYHYYYNQGYYYPYQDYYMYYNYNSGW